MHNKGIPSNRYFLSGLEADDTTSAQLLEIARLHCKLDLEHGKAARPKSGAGRFLRKCRVYGWQGLFLSID
jgi:hypothetical protein